MFSLILYVARKISYRCLGSKLYFRNSTHNDSTWKLKLQKLDRDGKRITGASAPQSKAEWFAIWPVHPSSLAPSIYRVIERVRWNSP
jgi:hypothetical protein